MFWPPGWHKRCQPDPTRDQCHQAKQQSPTEHASEINHGEFYNKIPILQPPLSLQKVV